MIVVPAPASLAGPFLSLNREGIRNGAQMTDGNKNKQHNIKNQGKPDEIFVSQRRKVRVKKAAMIFEKFFKDLRPNTKRRYMTVLQDFLNFCGCELKHITEQDVFAYWDDVKGRNYSSMTERNLMRCLRSMFDYAFKRGEIETNPFYTAAIRMPRENSNRKRQSAAVPFEQVLDFCNEPSSRTKKGIRDRAFLALLFGGGLRPSEAQNLRLNDVCAYETKAGGTIIYLLLRDPKSGQPEEQPIPHWAAERVLRLLEQRQIETESREAWLFCGYLQPGIAKPGQWPYRSIARMFARYRDAIGLGKDITLHSGRVTAISRLYERGANLKQLQQFARHAYTSTTERYIKLDEQLFTSLAQNLDYH